MGVKDLWSILEPSRERRPLESLRGKTVAIDLGIWVCELQAAIRNPTVLKPYLRNLFFRISALLEQEINVVVVADGKPPELKRQAMLERQKTRYNKNGIVIKGDTNGAVGRSRFNGHLRECLELLRFMGVSVIESDGEAEATCAAMNAVGIVDAVITDDSDAFLYGARLVIRNFNLEGKIPEADFYCMDSIERRLRLSRNKLIALGVFLGSDYCTSGVPGVGKETAMKYLNCFSMDDDELLLAYLKSWSSTEFRGDHILRNQISVIDSMTFDKFDKSMRCKAATAKELVLDAVIEEYLHERQLDPCAIKWNIPNLVALEAFFTRHLEWVSEYTVAKVVPLMTFWQLTNDGKNSEIVAHSITKTRVRNGKTMYEVQWKKLDCDVWTIDKDYYITIERKELVEKAMPELVKCYSSLLEMKVAKKPASRKTKPKVNAAASSQPSAENKENEDIIDLSETLEKSLLLFDNDDEPTAAISKATNVQKSNDVIAKPKQQRIFTFIRPKQAHVTEASTEEKRSTDLEIEDGKSEVKTMAMNTEVKVSDSPLPLWKRIGLTKSVGSTR